MSARFCVNSAAAPGRSAPVTARLAKTLTSACAAAPASRSKACRRLCIPRLVYNEARRQWSLLRIREELKRRGITPETFRYATRDVTRVLGKVHYEPVRAAVADGLRVKCVVLKGFAGILNTDTQEHTSFSKEFSDRVRVIACLTRLPNMTHSDTATEALAARDWKTLRKKTRSEPNDALVLVWGDEQDTETACEEIAIRGREATEGIPSDTRQVLQDGTTGFERVLPGAQRMYPDTDLPPLVIATERIQRICARLPMFVWDREARYRELGIPEDTVVPLVLSRRAGLFDRLVDELKIDATLAAVVLCQRFKAYRREGLDPARLTDDEVYEVFQAHAEGHLVREGIREVISHILKQASADVSDGSRVAAAIEQRNLRVADVDEMRMRTAGLLRERNDARFKTLEQKHRCLMGKLMTAFAGRAEGLELSRLLAIELGLTPAPAGAQKVQA